MSGSGFGPCGTPFQLKLNPQNAGAFPWGSRRFFQFVKSYVRVVEKLKDEKRAILLNLYPTRASIASAFSAYQTIFCSTAMRMSCIGVRALNLVRSEAHVMATVL
jgi:hypothetical protein